MLTIDGSLGEGGGQILRTSLALSLITQQPFRIHQIRANRDKPGLARQHLMAVEAAAQVGGASVEGAAVGSTELTFRPGTVRPGDYTFSIGTAGSTTLVLQTVLPPLMLAGGPSLLSVSGGTHNTKAPPFDFLDRAFVPLVRKMGPKIDLELEAHGFYPAGGGRIVAGIEPVAKLAPLSILDPRAIERTTARATLVGLPRHIGQRMLDTVKTRLRWRDEDLVLQEHPAQVSRGTFLALELQSRQLTELFSAIGRLGVPAEQIAEEVIVEAEAYLAHQAPVGEHLADQLILPLALAGSGSFRTGPLSEHTRTNVRTVRTFLPVEIRVKQDGGTNVIEIEGR